MPVVIDDGITLILRDGQTITLYERALSVADRKDIRKRIMLLGSELGYKKRQAEEIDRRVEALEKEGGKQEEIEKLVAEGADIAASLDMIEYQAEVLARRFESWDLYDTRADEEAGISVPLTKEAIVKYAEKPKRAALIGEIVEKLRKYDEGEEKNVSTAAADFGSSSTATAVS